MMRNFNALKPRNLFRIGVLAGAVSLAACSDGKEPVAYCTFSDATKTVTIPDGGGADDALLQIAGVNHGTCYDSALKEVGELNPGENVGTPEPGQDFLVPVSAVFHEG